MKTGMKGGNLTVVTEDRARPHLRSFAVAVDGSWYAKRFASDPGYLREVGCPGGPGTCGFRIPLLHGGSSHPVSARVIRPACPQ